MYLNSFCHIYVTPIVDTYHLLNLNVIISMLIVYSNKCICTPVLFVFLSTFPSSILSPPTCPPPPPLKLVFRVSGLSRHDDILQALEVRLNGSHC